MVWHFFRWILAVNLRWHLWSEGYPGGWEQKPRQLAWNCPACQGGDFLKTWTNNDQYLLISVMVGKMWSFFHLISSWSYCTTFFFNKSHSLLVNVSSCFVPKPKFSLQVSFLVALNRPRRPGDVSMKMRSGRQTTPFPIPRCGWEGGVYSLVTASVWMGKDYGAVKCHLMLLVVLNMQERIRTFVSWTCGNMMGLWDE